MLFSLHALCSAGLCCNLLGGSALRCLLSDNIAFLVDDELLATDTTAEEDVESFSMLDIDSGWFSQPHNFPVHSIFK